MYSLITLSGGTEELNKHGVFSYGLDKITLLSVGRETEFLLCIAAETLTERLIAAC